MEENKYSKEDLDNQKKVEQSEMSIKAILQDQLRALKEMVGTKTESVDLSKEVLSLHRETNQFIGENFDKTKEIVRGKDAINASIKKTTSLEKEVRAEVERLNVLAMEGDELAKAEAENLAQKLGTLKGIQAGLDNESKTRDKINKKMGIFDNILKGIKDIPFIGELGLGEDLLENMQLAAQNGKSTIGAAFSTIGSAAREAIGPAFFTGVIVAAFQASNSVRDIGRNLALSSKESKNFRNELALTSAGSEDILVTTQGLIEANQTLNEVRGTGVKFTKEQLLDTNRLLKAEVLTVAAAGELSKIANVTGQGIREAYLNQIDGVLAAEQESGVRLDIKGTLEATNKISGQIRAQLGANPALIAESVAQAKSLGMELEEVASAGKALLDFESSISNELEAELLIGKQLNLERARAAALTGDFETLTREINANVGDFYEFSKLNVLQQDALAKSVGMSTDQLSEQLLKKADLNKLAQEARADGRDDIAANLEQLSAQDNFNASVTKLKGVFTDIASILTPIIDGVASLAAFLSESTLAAAALGGIMAVLAVNSIVGAIGSIYRTFAGIPYGLGLLLASGVTGALLATVQKAKSVQLAEGGIVEPSPGGTLATIGEGGEAEMVVPLSKASEMGFGGINKETMIEALLEAEKRKFRVPFTNQILIREKDSNYADANPINNQGNSYEVKYETSFS